MSSSWSPPPSKMLRQVCVAGRGLSPPSLYITRQQSSSGSNHHLTSVLPPPAASLQTSDERGGGDHPRPPPRLPRPRQPQPQPQPQLHRLRLGGGGQGGHPAQRLQPDHRAVPWGQAAPQRARLLHHPPLLLPRPRRCRFGKHWTELWYPNPQIVHVLKIVRQKMKNSCRPNNILVKVQDHGTKIISYFLHSGAALLRHIKCHIFHWQSYGLFSMLTFKLAMPYTAHLYNISCANAKLLFSKLNIFKENSSK